MNLNWCAINDLEDAIDELNKKPIHRKAALLLKAILKGRTVYNYQESYEK